MHPPAARSMCRAVIALSLLPTHLLAQTTYYVSTCGSDEWSGLSPLCAAAPNGPKRTIQNAINSAQSGDTVLVEAGTYTGQGNRDIDFGGRDIVLRSVSGPAATIIDAEASAQNHRRVFHLSNGETRRAQIEGFTVRGGNAGDEINVPGKGAGILLQGASPTIRGCLLYGTTVSGVATGKTCLGGSVASEGGNPLFIDCDFSGGSVGNAGGVLWIDGDAVLQRCRILWGYSFGHSGGIHVQNGHLRLWECTIRGSADYRGGALGAWSATVTIEDSVLKGFADYGGGIYADAATITMDRSVIRESSAKINGGAMRADGSVASLTRCGLIKNRAQSGFGSAIRAEAGGSLYLSECVVALNHASYGRGVYAIETPVTIRGCTFADNDYAPILALSPAAIVANSIVRQSSIVNNPAVTGGPTVMYCNVRGGHAGVGNIDVDPLFMQTGDTRLGAENYRLRPGSPCIDAGRNADVTPGVTLDFAGNPRFADDPWMPNTGVGKGAITDMGAFEFAGTSCPADCDENGALTIADFGCFQARFTAGHAGADCNADGTLGISDFACFQNAFVAGCP